MDSTDKSRCRYNGINPFIRMSCVNAFTMKSNTKSIDSRHGRAIEDTHLANIEKWSAVHPKNRVNIINNAGFNDFQGPTWPFFPRLKDNTDSSLYIFFPFF